MAFIGTIMSALGVSKALGWLIAVAAVFAAIGGIYLAIHHSGEKAGAAKVTAKVQQAQMAAVADARHDEQAAANASATVATSTAQRTIAAAAVTHYIIEDLHNAIDAVPAPVPGAPLPAAPVDQLRTSLNTGIDRANRAADAADAVP